MGEGETEMAASATQSVLSGTKSLITMYSPRSLTITRDYMPVTTPTPKPAQSQQNTKNNSDTRTQIFTSTQHYQWLMGVQRM